MKAMKDTMATIAMVNDSTELGLGWTPEAFKSAVAATALDAYRFVDENGEPDRLQATLARHGEDDGARYPDSQELESHGADLVVLVEAAADGLDLSLFGEALTHGLGLADFCVMLAQKIDSMDEVNGMLELFIEAGEESMLHPDPTVLAFNRLHGEGGFANYA